VIQLKNTIKKSLVKEEIMSINPETSSSLRPTTIPPRPAKIPASHQFTGSPYYNNNDYCNCDFKLLNAIETPENPSQECSSPSLWDSVNRSIREIIEKVMNNR
jgi:hypothetical protein